MLKAGLFGYPIEHSLSPRIHTAAYEALGLDWQYALYPCPTEADFNAALDAAMKSPQDHVGFNVTTPYKVRAFERAQQHSAHAKVCRNANVLSVVKSSTAASGYELYADNTDGKGLVAALMQFKAPRPREHLMGARVVLFGSGAVARSALLSLAEEAAMEVAVVCRKPENLKRTLSEISNIVSDPRTLPRIYTVGMDETARVSEFVQKADILIDATTLGMDPGDGSVVGADVLHKDLLVVDVVYGHGETALLKAAREVGAHAMDGLGMLIEQAALTVELWASIQGLSVVAPREVMRRAALTPR